MARNVDADLQAGVTRKIQFSTYQLKHSVNEKIGTDDCDPQIHTCATEEANIGANEPNKVKEKVILLEL